jgi:hypothetical protein
MSKRRLVLNRESLTPLEADDLASVVGGISNLHPYCVLSLYQSCREPSCHCTRFTDTCE